MSTTGTSRREVWRRVWETAPAAFHGEHFDVGDVCLEPKASRPQGPTLWFGGASMHDRLLARLVRHSSGFNPLGLRRARWRDPG